MAVAGAVLDAWAMADRAPKRMKAASRDGRGAKNGGALKLKSVRRTVDGDEEGPGPPSVSRGRLPITGFVRRPLLARRTGLEAAAAESTGGVHFSGEPFGRRDVQFQQPQIRDRSAGGAARTPEFLLHSHRLASSPARHSVPSGCSSRSRKRDFRPFRRRMTSDRAGGGVALGEHRAEPAFALGAADQGARQHRAGEPRAASAGRDSRRGRSAGCASA